jgi:hypothetical protein
MHGAAACRRPMLPCCLGPIWPAHAVCREPTATVCRGRCWHASSAAAATPAAPPPMGCAQGRGEGGLTTPGACHVARQSLDHTGDVIPKGISSQAPSCTPSMFRPPSAWCTVLDLIVQGALMWFRSPGVQSPATETHACWAPSLPLPMSTSTSTPAAAHRAPLDALSTGLHPFGILLRTRMSCVQRRGGAHRAGSVGDALLSQQPFIVGGPTLQSLWPLSVPLAAGALA